MLNPREKIEEKVTDWLLLLSMLKCRVAQGEKLGHTTTAPRHHHHDLNVECVCVQLNRSVINSPFLSLSLSLSVNQNSRLLRVATNYQLFGQKGAGEEGKTN